MDLLRLQDRKLLFFATNINENSTTLNFQRVVKYCNLVQPTYVIVSLHNLQDRKILNV